MATYTVGEYTFTVPDDLEGPELYSTLRDMARKAKEFDDRDRAEEEAAEAAAASVNTSAPAVEEAPSQQASKPTPQQVQEARRKKLYEETKAASVAKMEAAETAEKEEKEKDLPPIPDWWEAVAKEQAELQDGDTELQDQDEQQEEAIEEEEEAKPVVDPDSPLGKLTAERDLVRKQNAELETLDRELDELPELGQDEIVPGDTGDDGRFKLWAPPKQVAGDDAGRSLTNERNKLTNAHDRRKVARARDDSFTEYVAPTKGVSVRDLHKDDNWLRASEQWHIMQEGAAFDGTAEELAEYGMSHIRRFNNNSVAIAAYGARLQGKSKEKNLAFLYLLEQYDAAEGDWRSMRDSAGWALADPTNVLGAATLGSGFLIKKAAMEAAKKAFKAKLLKGIGRSGLPGAIMGGAILGGHEYVAQGVKVGAEVQDERDGDAILKQVGIGATAGLVFGTGLDVVGSTIASKFVRPGATPDPGNLDIEFNPLSSLRKINPREESTGGNPGYRMVRDLDTNGVVAKVTLIDDRTVPDSFVFTKVTVDGLGRNTNNHEVQSLLVGALDESAAVGRHLMSDRKVDRQLQAGWLAMKADGYDVKINSNVRREANGSLASTDGKPVYGIKWNSPIPALRDPTEIIPTGAGYTKKTTRTNHDSHANSVSKTRRYAAMSKEDMALVHAHVESSSMLGVVREDVQAMFNGANNLFSYEMRALLKKMNDESDAAVRQIIESDIQALQARMTVNDEARAILTNPAGRSVQMASLTVKGSDELSVEALMRDRGLSRRVAEVESERLYDIALRAHEKKQTKALYASEIEDAIKTGDIARAARAVVNKHEHALAEKAGLESVGDKVGNVLTRGVDMAVEAGASSLLMGLKTQLLNTIPNAGKTVFGASLRAIMDDPFDPVTRAGVVAHYRAMAQFSGEALEAARATFVLEANVITSADGALLNSVSIPGGVGAVVRIAPRALATTDEMFGRMAYRALVAEEAAKRGATAAIEQGLKGQARRDLINEYIILAQDKAYGSGISIDAFDIVMRKGIAKGLKGQELADYAAMQVTKRGKILSKGTDQEAVERVNHMLYRNTWDDSKTLGFAGNAYEKLINKAPAFRILGQWFFRVVVNVTAEGLKLVPGANLFVPGFTADLMGRNGDVAQLRARGTAMLSVGIGSYFMMLWADGKLQGGDFGLDMMNRGAMSDGSQGVANTLEVGGGKLKMQGVQPLMPFMIMANGFEQMEHAHMQAMHGDALDEGLIAQGGEYVQTGISMLMASIHALGMTEGIKGMLALMEGTVDQSLEDDKLVTFTSKMLRAYVPNLLNHQMNDIDDRVIQPATFSQMANGVWLDPWKGGITRKRSEAIPFSYDVLGNVRRKVDTGMWSQFTVTTKEELAKGRTDQQMKVIDKLNQITRITNVSFQLNVKDQLFHGIDLRTRMTKDGKATWWDRVNEKLVTSKWGLGTLERVLDMDHIAIGNSEKAGPMVQEVNKILRGMREQAYAEVIAEEEGVHIDAVLKELKAGMAESGSYDSNYFEFKE